MTKIRTFSSASKPVQLRLEFENSSLDIIYKKENLKRDLGVMSIFKFLNKLWRESIEFSVDLPPEILTYEVYPLTNSSSKDQVSIIEIIPNSIPFKKLDELALENQCKWRSMQISFLENENIALSFICSLSGYAL
jgi:hypothetical protein